MGYNTTVVVMNDALDDIERDPNFGRNLVRAVLKAGCYGEEACVPAGGHTCAAVAVESHHADQAAVVIVGDNRGRRLMLSYAGLCSMDDDKIELSLLERLAHERGFDLVKRRP